MNLLMPSSSSGQVNAKQVKPNENEPVIENSNLSYKKVTSETLGLPLTGVATSVNSELPDTEIATSENSVLPDTEVAGTENSEIVSSEKSELSNSQVATAKNSSNAMVVPMNSTGEKTNDTYCLSESGCASMDMFKDFENVLIPDHKGVSSDVGQTLDGECEKTPLEERINSIEVENTSEAKSILSMNVTPTKLPAPPTPRNIMANLNNLQGLDDEEEREKENKIINAAQTGSGSVLKRRSGRRSTRGTSKQDELKEGKSIPGKELVDIPLIVVDPPEIASKVISPGANNLLNKFVSNLITSSKTSQDKGHQINECQKQVSEISSYSSKEINLIEKATVDAGEDTCSTVDGKSMVVNEPAEACISKDDKADAENDERSDNLSTDWEMAAPRTTKRRKRKSIEEERKCSPKLLRSKRLSLTKRVDEQKIQKKEIRKSMPAIKTDSDNEKTNTSIIVNDEKSAKIKIIETPDKVAGETEASGIKSSKSRKRKSANISQNKVEEKKMTLCDRVSSEDNCPTPLLVKTYLTGKHRKKKVIKSNVKISPNILEQWLIITGKTVVTPMISQDTVPDSETSQIIDDEPNIHIDLNTPTEIVVKQIEPEYETLEGCNGPTSSPQNISETKDFVIDVSPGVGDSEDILNRTSIGECTEMGQSSGSEEELIAASPPRDLLMESLKCNETEVPSTPELDESLASMRKRRMARRELTPVREVSTEILSPERRSLRSRSAQMVRMATTSEDNEDSGPSFKTPIRKRPSILPFSRTEK